MFLSDTKMVNEAPEHYVKIVKKACLANKIVFIHIPKNAGTSIKKALRLNKSPCHLFASEIKHAIGPKEFGKNARVCVIRNPWDRLVSIYCQQRTRRKTLFFKGIKGSGGLVPGFEDGVPTFEDFILKYFPKTWWQGRSLSQTKYIQHSNKDKIIVNKILRYEKLDEEWEKLSKELCLNVSSLNRINKSKDKKNNYREFYKTSKKGFNHKLIDKASELVEIDAKNFGYKF